MPRNNRSKQSKLQRRERTARGRAYRISVRGERRANPDIGKVARVVVALALALAQAQAEADAEADAQAAADAAPETTAEQATMPARDGADAAEFGDA